MVAVALSNHLLFGQLAILVKSSQQALVERILVGVSPQEIEHLLRVGIGTIERSPSIHYDVTLDASLIRGRIVNL